MQWRALAGLLLLAICLAPSVRAEQAAVLQVRPPAGFEGFAAPQAMVVDIIYGGQVVGVARVMAAPGEVVLVQPAEVLALLPALVPAREAEVLAALSGQLDAHAGLSCQPRPRQGCGLLEPEVAGVIFDDAVLRLAVFVNPAYLALDPEGDTARHLPAPTADALAFYNPLSAFYGAYASQSDVSQEVSVFSDSYLTYGAHSLHVATSYRSEELTTGGGDESGFALDEASALKVAPGWLYEGGLFRTSPIGLLGSQRFLGASVLTTTETRLDLDRAQGSALTVFLPSRSTVELVVDGRVYARRTYPAGNQAIDTAGLPDGAYDVVLRIRDDAGNVTEETQFFAKSIDVPLRDAPTYILQAGLLVEEERRALPAVTPTPLLRAGTAWRLTNDLALGGNLLATDEVAVGSLDLDYFSSLGILSASLLGSSDGDYGLSVTLYGRLGDLSYSLSGQMLERAEEPDLYALDSDRDPLGPSYRQLNFSLSYPLHEDVDLSLRGFWRDDAYSDDSYLVGPLLTWRLYQDSWIGISLDAQVTKTDDETYGLAQVRLFQTIGEKRRWSVNAAAGVSSAFDRGDDSAYETGVRPYGSAQVQWADGDLLEEDLRLYGGLLYDLDASLSGFAGVDHASEWALLSGEARTTRLDGGDTASSLQAGLSTALSLDQRGVAVGGSQLAQSAVVVLLESADDATLYDILVDGQPRLTVRGSTRSVLPLPPYRTYRVAVRPQGGSAVSGNLLERSVTLYPGNSVTLEWATERVVAVFGRALDAAGSPLANARLEGGAEPALTDADGFYQVDLAEGTALRVTTSRGTCLLDLSDLRFDEVPVPDYLNAGDRTCR